MPPKSEMGINPFDLGKFKRFGMSEAGQSVSEIAYQLDFKNLSHFPRLFKKEVGISPKIFKSQFLN